MLREIMRYLASMVLMNVLYAIMHRDVNNPAQTGWVHHTELCLWDLGLIMPEKRAPGWALCTVRWALLLSAQYANWLLTTFIHNRKLKKTDCGRIG